MDIGMDINYEQDIRIDPNSLDVEWLEQPGLMRKYTIHSALMEKTKDEAKEKLDLMKAQIELNIRENPEKYGLAKITEAAVQSTVLLQEEYQEAAREYNDAKYEHNIAVGAVRSIDQRKTALENLVKLLGTSYFAGPKAPRDLHQEYLEHQERKNSNTKVKISRKKGS